MAIRYALAPIAAALLLMSGCGSDDDDDERQPTAQLANPSALIEACIDTAGFGGEIGQGLHDIEGAEGIVRVYRDPADGHVSESMVTVYAMSSEAEALDQVLAAEQLDDTQRPPEQTRVRGRYLLTYPRDPGPAVFRKIERCLP